MRRRLIAGRASPRRPAGAGALAAGAPLPGHARCRRASGAFCPSQRPAIPQRHASPAIPPDPPSPQPTRRRARRVMTKVRPNEILDDAQRLAKALKDVSRLKQKLKQVRSKK